MLVLSGDIDFQLTEEQEHLSPEILIVGLRAKPQTSSIKHVILNPNGVFCQDGHVHDRMALFYLGENFYLILLN